MPPSRVLVASRWPLLRIALRQVFAGASGVEVVGAAGDWRDVLARARRLRPDACVVACLSSDRESIFALRKLERRLGCRTVVIGPADPPAPVWWMLIAGVSGYVTLDQPAPQIIEAVRSACAGSTVYSAEVISMAAALSWGERPGWASLSTREIEAARLVARGWTDPQIATSLGVTEATVRKHVGRALHRLDCSDRVELVARLFAAGVLGAADMEERLPA
jgi:DNA-binding NarL/FixJ family response regulator